MGEVPPRDRRARPQAQSTLIKKNANAVTMANNIRTGFWVALALSTLVVLISLMGEMLGIRWPLSAAARSWALLVLTTPVVFWCGWIFVAGAFHSLVSKRLDMSVLIAVGVL